MYSFVVFVDSSLSKLSPCHIVPLFRISEFEALMYCIQSRPNKYTIHFLPHDHAVSE